MEKRDSDETRLQGQERYFHRFTEMNAADDLDQRILSIVHDHFMLGGKEYGLSTFVLKELRRGGVRLAFRHCSNFCIIRSWNST